MDFAGGNPDIADLLNRYGAIGLATGPMAASLVARLIFGKNRIVTATVRLSAAWLAARVFLTPHVDQMKETLVTLISTIHNSGF